MGYGVILGRGDVDTGSAGIPVLSGDLKWQGGRLGGEARCGWQVNLGVKYPKRRAGVSACLPVLDERRSLREVAERYQRALTANPRHAESLAGMCVVALVSGQNEAAVRMAEAAVEAAPGMAITLPPAASRAPRRARQPLVAAPRWAAGSAPQTPGFIQGLMA